MLSKKSLISLMGYVPALVVQYFAQHEQIKELPAKQSFQSVVMFTDVSGFTNLTESLSKIGNEGPELTAFVINRYMELLVKAISQSGGDILKFAGDAMIVVWPPSYKTNIVQIHEELRLTCRMALQNALDIQNKLNDIIQSNKQNSYFTFSYLQNKMMHAIKRTQIRVITYNSCQQRIKQNLNSKNQYKIPLYKIQGVYKTKQNNFIHYIYINKSIFLRNINSQRNKQLVCLLLKNKKKL